MFRQPVVKIVLLMGFALQACATMERLDGSTEEELERFRMSKDQMWNEVLALRSENEYLKGQLNTQGEEPQRLKELEGRVAALKQENERIRNEKLELGEKLSALELKERELEGRVTGLQKEKRDLEMKLSGFSQEPGKGPESLKIKVLSGDGNLDSAREMADRLRKMGYQVRTIDLAPRATFTRHTVYYAPKADREADGLVGRIGGEAISKPLSWPSRFDLIVVTGRER